MSKKWFDKFNDDDEYDNDKRNKKKKSQQMRNDRRGKRQIKYDTINEDDENE